MHVHEDVRYHALHCYTETCPINPIFSSDVLYFLGLCPIKICQCSGMTVSVHLLTYSLTYLITYCGDGCGLNCTGCRRLRKKCPQKLSCLSVPLRGLNSSTLCLSGSSVQLDCRLIPSRASLSGTSLNVESFLVVNVRLTINLSVIFIL